MSTPRRTWPRSWVVLDHEDGRLICHPDDICGVEAFHLDGCVTVYHRTRTVTVRPASGESQGDALARVCGLLGIEVTR